MWRLLLLSSRLWQLKTTRFSLPHVFLISCFSGFWRKRRFYMGAHSREFLDLCFWNVNYLCLLITDVILLFLSCRLSLWSGLSNTWRFKNLFGRHLHVVKSELLWTLSSFFTRVNHVWGSCIIKVLSKVISYEDFLMRVHSKIFFLTWLNRVIEKCSWMWKCSFLN